LSVLDCLYAPNKRKKPADSSCQRAFEPCRLYWNSRRSPLTRLRRNDDGDDGDGGSAKSSQEKYYRVPSRKSKKKMAVVQFGFSQKIKPRELFDTPTQGASKTRGFFGAQLSVLDFTRGEAIKESVKLRLSVHIRTLNQLSPLYPFSPGRSPIPFS